MESEGVDRPMLALLILALLVFGGCLALAI